MTYVFKELQDSISPLYWVHTDFGLKWLDSKKGYRWLESEEGLYWINEEKYINKDSYELHPDFYNLPINQKLTGKQWLNPYKCGSADDVIPNGTKWLLKTHNNNNWLKSIRSVSWLLTDCGEKFLNLCEDYDFITNNLFIMRELILKNWLCKKSGNKWLETVGKHWLTTTDGTKLLSTLEGHMLLTTQWGNQWLMEDGGQMWIETKEGVKWLSEKGGVKWLETDGGYNWLEREGGGKWLLTERGKKWFDTDGGYNWLEKEGGIKWLLTERGYRWLTAERNSWVKSQNFIRWLETSYCDEFLTLWKDYNFITNNLNLMMDSNWLITEKGGEWRRTKCGLQWILEHSNWINSQKKFAHVMLSNDKIILTDNFIMFCTDANFSYSFTNQFVDWLFTDFGIKFLNSHSGELFIQWLQSNKTSKEFIFSCSAKYAIVKNLEKHIYEITMAATGMVINDNISDMVIPIVDTVTNNDMIITDYQ